MVRSRLARRGKHKRPFYRVVATSSRSPRDGKFLEVLGTFDPLVESGGVRLNTERINEWLKKGAQASATVKSLLRQSARTVTG